MNLLKFILKTFIIVLCNLHDLCLLRGPTTLLGLSQDYSGVCVS